jgi:hypothetical protein
MAHWVLPWCGTSEYPRCDLDGSRLLRANHLKSGCAWVEVQVRVYRARQFKMTEPNDNWLLTKLDYLESWAFGARVLACGPAGSVGVDPWPLTRKSSSPSQITAR